MGKLVRPTLTLEPPERTTGRLALAVRGGPRVPLGERARIGTAGDCELRLRDRYASRHHAEVSCHGGQVILQDLSSKNGTWLGELRIDAVPWLPGVPVRVGASVIELVDDGPAPTVDDVVPVEIGAPPSMLGHSPAFARLERALKKVAGNRRPLLLHGETGTGKELAARRVHELGPRAHAPFIAINCASIVDALAESELFGHVRGAFTGAVRPHAGAFVRADGGTLFLDEIGELPLQQQAKLLRVLETGRVQAVGGEDEVAVDVRVIGATHRDLERMVAEHRFREDLFHRLSVLVVELPPLRERVEDIPLLLARFVREASEELGRTIVLAPRLPRGRVRAPVAGQHPRAQERGRARGDDGRRSARARAAAARTAERTRGALARRSIEPRARRGSPSRTAGRRLGADPTRAAAPRGRPARQHPPGRRRAGDPAQHTRRPAQAVIDGAPQSPIGSIQSIFAAGDRVLGPAPADAGEPGAPAEPARATRAAWPRAIPRHSHRAPRALRTRRAARRSCSRCSRRVPLAPARPGVTVLSRTDADGTTTLVCAHPEEPEGARGTPRPR